ncbi:MAG: MobF family relaxase, partial [Opitutaceae bacterium]
MNRVRLDAAVLRPRPQLSLRNAREYFREHLCVGEYYAEGQKVVGEWIGQGAFDLGLSGSVKQKDFLALCEGRHPETGKWLTQRHNGVRREEGRTAPNRRIFHDFVISPPKSVSVVALYQDPRIVELHSRAVGIAMKELEKFTETRVRRRKQNAERVTGNFAAACFQHETSRELDPHLHTHCVAFNATFDPVEGRWKALQTVGMYRAQKFVENLYFHEVARGLRTLGYEIENNARNFEIKGMPASVISRFSKRHQQIEAEAERQIAEGFKGDVGELRTRIAHERRRRKIKNSTADKLRSHWEKQLSLGEKQALAEVCG